MKYLVLSVMILIVGCTTVCEDPVVPERSVDRLDAGYRSCGSMYWEPIIYINESLHPYGHASDVIGYSLGIRYIIARGSPGGHVVLHELPGDTVSVIVNDLMNKPMAFHLPMSEMWSTPYTMAMLIYDSTRAPMALLSFDFKTGVYSYIEDIMILQNMSIISRSYGVIDGTETYIPDLILFDEEDEHINHDGTFSPLNPGKHNTSFGATSVSRHVLIGDMHDVLNGLMGSVDWSGMIDRAEDVIRSEDAIRSRR